MGYTIITKIIQPQPTASIRTQVPGQQIGNVLGQMLPEVWSYLEQQHIQPAGPPFIRYHHFADELVDLEAGLPIAHHFTIAHNGQHVIGGELPGGEVASTWHAGASTSLGKAYTAIGTWMTEQHRIAAALPWEVYWTDPQEVPDQSLWRTEVVWPLQ